MKITINVIKPCKSKRADFLESHLPHQSFSLSKPIIHYITMKPSNAKGYQKLVQTCKYFFIKNPIIVVEKFNISNYFCSTDYKNSRIWIENVKSKWWITKTLYVGDFEPNEEWFINPNFYRIDAKALSFASATISFNSLIFLISNIEEMNLSYKAFTNGYNSSVPLQKSSDEISKKLSDNYPLKSITPNSIKQLLKFPGFSKLKILIIEYVPDTFDIETFFTDIIKKNKQTKFRFYFVLPSSMAFKNRLEAIVDEILATENHDYKVPLFSCCGFQMEKYWKMFSLFSKC